MLGQVLESECPMRTRQKQTARGSFWATGGRLLVLRLLLLLLASGVRQSGLGELGLAKRCWNLSTRPAVSTNFVDPCRTDG